MGEFRKNGLAPLIGESPEILILGSLPGDESLRLQQYYGNPRNMFWRVMAKVFGETVPDDYSGKSEFLKSHGIALWDVFSAAEREGSLDANIRGEEYNDLAGLLGSNPTIRTVVLNGGKAEKAFRTYARRHAMPEGIRVLPFTSTSMMSLSAGWDLDRISKQWEGMLQ